MGKNERKTKGTGYGTGSAPAAPLFSSAAGRADADAPAAHQTGQGTLFALCFTRIAAPAAPLFSLVAGRADAGPPRTDPYHARGRHPVHASVPGRQGWIR